MSPNKTIGKTSDPVQADPREDLHFRVLSLLQDNPHLTQRELAAALGVSLGKTNYLLKALLEKGQLKIAAFRRSSDKLDKVAYLLTPEGISNRLALTQRYLARKTREYEALQAEIAALLLELDGNRLDGQGKHRA